MNLRMPSDFTPEEVELFEYLSNGCKQFYSVVDLYRVLDDDLDKFILCYVYEAGRTQKSLQGILGLTKSQINTKMKKIRATLYKHYKNRNLLK
jgi:hypothetical protein